MPTLTKNKKGLVFQTNKPHLLTPYFPKNTYIQKPGVLAVPYKMDTWRLLNNKGYPNIHDWHPMKHVYNYPKVKLTYDMYPHAKITAEVAAGFKRGFILNDPRLGKSSSIIALTDFLQQHSEIASVLIIAPLSTLHSVWADEIQGMIPHKRVGVLHHKSKTGAAMKSYRRALLKKKLDFYVINPDGVKLALPLLLEAQQNGMFNCVVIDESTEYGNHTTARWKAMYQLSKSPYFYMMTGTPGNPEQVYGQARMMNPQSVPSNKQVWKLRTMIQITEYKWVPRNDADEIIKEVLQPAIRFKKRDVWKDMPKELVIPRKVELSAKSKKLMQILDDDRGVIIAGTEVSVANAAVLAQKTLQIASGTMILEDKDAIRLPVDAHLQTVMDLYKESQGKMIIYAHFTETISYIADLLEGKKLNDQIIKTETVDGRTASGKRPGIFRSFQNQAEPHILIAHPKTVSYGVELGAADQIVFWGPPMISAFLYQQAKDRLFSSHQKSEQPVIYQLYATSVEKRAFDNLERGVEWQTEMSDLFKEIV